MTTNIYLDIDGVLLANEYHAAKHVHEFLELIHQRFPDTTYWLTTHCKGGADRAEEHLAPIFEPKTMELIRDIKPTDWGTYKTEAIDFTKPFLWFDDDLFIVEKQKLEEHNVLDNWIEVDLRKDVDALQKFVTSFPTPINELR